MIVEVIEEDGTPAGRLSIDAQGRVTALDGSDLLREIADFSKDGFSIDRSVVEGGVAYNLQGTVIRPDDEAFLEALNAELEDDSLKVGRVVPE